MQFGCRNKNRNCVSSNYLKALKISSRIKANMAFIFRAASLAILVILTLVQLTEQLKFSAVQIPSLVQRNTNFWLSCQYNLDNSPPKQDQLYSVKWYKNNEEFYRLLLNPPADNQAISSTQDEFPATNQPSNQQQHYFAQAGVNVMMSSSNATHVRLLNASLESEGVYACEISTQNLSTIRYEREIRVYVLPQTRLNIIGFRNGYSLGDKVDLICASDFSRPKPALAWFINGQRIGHQPENRNRWFELELETRSKLQEPSLFKLNLRLKFKLSHEFLQAFAPHQRPRKNQANGTSNDQSQTPATRQQQLAGGGGGGGGGGQPAVERFELQCRYKLTEVSDVTYNELTLTHQQGLSWPSRAAADGAARGKPQDAALPVGQVAPRGQAGSWRSAEATEASGTSSNWQDNAGRDEVDEKRKWVSGSSGSRRGRNKRMVENEWFGGLPVGGDSSSGTLVRVNKAPDGNQVTQSKSPASGRQLWRSIQAPLQSRRQPWAARPEPANASCLLGSLVLMPEDPLLIEPIGGSGNGGRRRRDIDPELDMMMMMIRVNCSTVGALELMMMGASDAGNGDGDEGLVVATQTGNHKALQWRSRKQQDDDDDDDDDVEQGSEISSSSSSSASSRGPRATNEPASYSGYCGDQAARRRSLVSGKSLIVNEAPALTSNQRPRGRSSGHSSNLKHQVGRQLVAYLSLTAHYNNGSANLQATQQQDSNNPATGDDSLSSSWPDRNNDEIDAQSFQQQHNRNQYHHQFGSALVAAAAAATQTTIADSSDSPEAGEGGSGARVALAPPLLEWFINNQEAPRASASYSPELPLLKLSAGKLRLAEQPTGAPVSGDKDAEVLPPIDYADYFANFDSRPQKQHLMLNLKPDKRHFLTTDSKLRLRCSSTQAQVLASDFATLTIVPLTSTGLMAKGQGQGQGWQAKSRLQKQQQQAGTIQTSRGASRASSAASAGTRPSPGSSGAQLRNRPSRSTIGLLTISAWLWTTVCCLFAHKLNLLAQDL